MNELREKEDFIDFEKLSFMGADKKHFGFRVYKYQVKFVTVKLQSKKTRHNRRKKRSIN